MATRHNSSRSAGLQLRSSSSSAMQKQGPPADSGAEQRQQQQQQHSPPSKKSSSKRSASSLVSSLVSTLTASPPADRQQPQPSTSTTSSSSKSLLPCINGRPPSFTSSSGASRSNSRPPSCGLMSSTSAQNTTTNNTPFSSIAGPRAAASAAATAAGQPGIARAPSSPSLVLARGDSAGVAGAGKCSSPSPPASSRSFTEPGTASATRLSLLQGLKSSNSSSSPAGALLPPLSKVSGSYSLEGGRTVLFKQAAVKFFGAHGEPVDASSICSADSASCSTSGTSSSCPGQVTTGCLSSGGGGGVNSSSSSAQHAQSDFGAASCSGRAPSKADALRRQSKVSFHAGAPQVSFFHSDHAHDDADSDDDRALHTSTSAPVSSAGASQPDSLDSSSARPASAGRASGGASPRQGMLLQSTSSAGQQDAEAPPRPLLAGPPPAGLTAMAHRFKRLTLTFDSSSIEQERHSTSSSEGGTRDAGSGLSIDPTPTPKDGSSELRAQTYKQHHGYLPTPCALSAGMLHKVWSMNSDTEAADLFADGGTLDDSTGPSTQPPTAAGEQEGAEVAAAAACTDAGASTIMSLQPLPPGVVPVFGAAAAAATATMAAADKAVQDDSRRADSPASCSSSAHASPRPLSRQAVDCSASDAGPSNSSRQTGFGQPLQLGPATLPGPLLLAVSPWLPSSMQRDHWGLSDFVVLKNLYDGYASRICRARDRRSGTIVALKLYRMHKLNDISRHQVAREVRLHMGLQHENIIQLYASWQEAGNVVLLQEFAGNGDLWTFIDANSGRLTERVTVSLVLQPFLRGLHFLHAAGIAHRDLKPENCLFGANMVLKLADFGLAVNLREEPAVTRVGTLDYMAPEVLRCPLKRHPGDNKTRTDLHYAEQVDAWAVGVLAFELMTGRAPFSAPGESDASIQAAICTATPGLPSRMSEPAKQFISAALNKAPAARPTVLNMLQHPWIRSYQRSQSNGRADPRTSQELGGRGRLLMSPSKQADACADGGAAAAAASACAGRQQDTQNCPAQGGVSSSANNSSGRTAAAAAAHVWNSDDNGLTGYASLDACI